MSDSKHVADVALKMTILERCLADIIAANPRQDSLELQSLTFRLQQMQSERLSEMLDTVYDMLSSSNTMPVDTVAATVESEDPVLAQALRRNVALARCAAEMDDIDFISSNLLYCTLRCSQEVCDCYMQRGSKIATLLSNDAVTDESDDLFASNPTRVLPAACANESAAPTSLYFLISELHLQIVEECKNGACEVHV